MKKNIVYTNKTTPKNQKGTNKKPKQKTTTGKGSKIIFKRIINVLSIYTLYSELGIITK